MKWTVGWGIKASVRNNFSPPGGPIETGEDDFFPAHILEGLASNFILWKISERLLSLGYSLQEYIEHHSKAIILNENGEIRREY